MLTLLACMDTGLNVVAADPGNPDTADTASPDTAPPEDSAAPCPVLSVSWRSPINGTVWLEGELQDQLGAVVVGWSVWTDASLGDTAAATLSACGVTAFRGTGAVDTDADGAADLWSCQLQSDSSFALIGEVQATLDGEPTTVTPIADPDSPGCGIFGSWQ